MIWNDTSSFSRSDTDRTPNSWASKAGKIYIKLHRHIHYPKDTWLLTCDPFFDKKVLLSKNADEAKAEALRMVRREFVTSLKAFGPAELKNVDVSQPLPTSITVTQDGVTVFHAESGRLGLNDSACRDFIGFASPIIGAAYHYRCYVEAAHRISAIGYETIIIEAGAETRIQPNQPVASRERM